MAEKKEKPTEKQRKFRAYIGLSLALLLLIIAGGFITSAVKRLGALPEFQEGGEAPGILARGYRTLSAAAVATWLGVALFIILFLAVIFSKEESIHIVELLSMLSIILIVIIGIMTAVGAHDIRISGVENNGAFKFAVVSAVLTLGVLGLLFIIFVAYKFSKREKDVKKKELIKEAKEEKKAEVPVKKNKVNNIPATRQSMWV